MDLTFSEEQEAIRSLAGQILGDKVSAETLRRFECGDAPDAPVEAWKALAAADLVGLGLPEAHGGGGYGFTEVCLLLEQVGLAVAPVPAYSTLVLGALPIARFGTSEQQQRWLPGIAAGEVMLTAALTEPGSSRAALTPSTTATAAGDGYVLNGEKWFVPGAPGADAVLVPATLPGGETVVFIIEAAADGVTFDVLDTISEQPAAVMTLSGARVGLDARLGGDNTDGSDVLAWLVPRAVAATCAMQVGVCEAALRITAKYVSEREQFNSKLATFQAVSQRAADAYIDTELVRLTAWQAVAQLDAGQDATEAVAIAKYFAADAAHRVVHAAQHLHGGIGMDLDYPIHRYFRWAKQLEARLGSGSQHLLDLGASLAAN